MTARRCLDGSPVVAVIGAGFSGLLTAIHLLRNDPTVRVTLVERAARLGPGRAYSTGNPDHLLNVRAANMSAFPGQPADFMTWAKVEGDAFVSRGRYGAYLQSLLGAELNDPDHADRLICEPSDVISAHPRDGRWQVALAGGRAFAADAVVLAVGFLPAAWPTGVDVAALPASTCVADPWSADLDALPDGDVLLVGTGLTMVDVALAVARPGRRVTAVSRRGLLPLGHAPTLAAPAPEAGLAGPIQALRALRAHAGEAGWRAAVDSVRPVTAATWRSWSLADRRRFLRHLRPWWDIHRHRMAPVVAGKIAQLRAAGALTVVAGHLHSLRASEGVVEARIRPRGETAVQTRLFSGVVNCASPQGDPGQTSEGLIADLHRRGLVRADALGLGLDLGPDLSVIGADGRASPGLFAVGPLTRGATWEAVAAPDLRNQTGQIAQAVLAWFHKVPVPAR
jgi:uncharacterized NAD(P)/FAD-binding protein YdhS